MNRVDIQGCEDLFDVFKVIKVEFSPELDKEYVYRMAIHLKPDFSDPPLLGDVTVEELLQRPELAGNKPRVYLRSSVGVNLILLYA